MAERQFGYADQTAFSAFTTEQLASDINYEIEIPLDYWKQHASIIPDDVNRRVNQLKHFLKLYQGDYSDYDSDGFPVTVNMHRLSANVMADTLAAFRPFLRCLALGALKRRQRAQTGFLRRLSRLRGTMSSRCRRALCRRCRTRFTAPSSTTSALAAAC